MSEVEPSSPEHTEPMPVVPVTPLSNRVAAAPAAAAVYNDPNPIPIWASLLVILLCLGGGGWIMHWYVTTDPLTHETKLLDPGVIPATPTRPPPSARMMGGAPAAAGPAIRKQDDTS